MADLNNVSLGGRLVADPELFTTPDGMAIVSVRFASNYRTKSKDGTWGEDAIFLNAKIFGRQAEDFAKFHKKGDRCLFAGELREERWLTKETKEKRSKMILRVDKWSFAGSKPSGGGQSHGGNSGGSFAPAGNSDFTSIDDTPF